ncbi:MAG TPA: S46 family peptidase, partial [Polyangia bacterium]|nr:S46 family peptidase [Polyangia bacterium]
RHSNATFFGIENSFKALYGRLEALQDKDFFATKVADEKALRAKVNDDPALKAKYAGAWDALAKAETDEHRIEIPLEFEEDGSGFLTTYFSMAKTLMRAADERPKPLAKRFREFRDSNIPALTQRLFSPAPIYDELETAKLTWSLLKLREKLGADHPFVKKVLGKQSPEELAKNLIAHTKLRDVAYRKQLWDGGKKAVDASDDAFIKLAKLIDPDARAIRKQYEDNIESVAKKNSEAVAKARFAVEGMNNYPDATFTLRLSYGAVKGYEEKGRFVAPITTFAGAFERATGREPFALPQTWLAAKRKLDLKTPFDMATTNDIIGGNSGSPVIDQKGEIVGLIFDGNIESLGGDYGFDPKVNRAVAVHSEALIHALDKIYGAERIVNELRPNRRASK